METTRYRFITGKVGRFEEGRGGGRKVRSGEKGREGGSRRREEGGRFEVGREAHGPATVAFVPQP